MLNHPTVIIIKPMRHGHVNALRISLSP